MGNAVMPLLNFAAVTAVVVIAINYQLFLTNINTTALKLLQQKT